MLTARLQALVALLTVGAAAGCSRTGLPSGGSELAGDAARDDARIDIEDVGDGGTDADAPDDAQLDATDADSTDTEVGPTCGDGIVDDGEECDDGNRVDDDLCDTHCRAPAALCEPCTTSDECGRVGDLCVEHRDLVGCARGCDGDLDCPGDAVCSTVRTVDGEPARQCTPAVGACLPCLDRDGDGFGVGVLCDGPDCDDSDPTVNPRAEEICDDLDNDCDGENDEVCPPDLFVQGETIRLSGDHLYDHVEIWDGGRIVVEPALEPTPECTPDGPGCLTIRARLVEIRVGSGVVATAAGACTRGLGDIAGFGPGLANVGPGGGAYGGAGGAGPDLSGGTPYGTSDLDDIEMGSAGSGFTILVPGFDGAACDDLVGLASEGGAGGGCVRVYAPDIVVEGFIDANGRQGQAATDGSVPAVVDGGAGGAGGGIGLFGARITLASGARIRANGGAGGSGATYAPRAGGTERDQCIGNGGGGGGGGRIKVFSTTRVTNAGATLQAAGGGGANGPQNNATGGRPGSIVVR
ncbi:MAG: hypothetical protein H6698_07700 [Myxococcales bacterium]|nr:hypothetical protein [Myxococcales bacterium]MCB9530162.1 hypothetical protein [Myxococcales bacterium]MCB9534172.1 hypothetical protein [Myxococcales bacterium]